MTEQEAKEKPIHEVWNRFNNIKNQFGKDSDYPKLIDLSRYANPAQARVDWIAEITMLRTVLLERCLHLKDRHPDPGIYLDFEPRADKNNIVVYACNETSMDVSALEDLSAIAAFWVWELQQRQKERGGL